MTEEISHANSGVDVALQEQQDLNTKFHPEIAAGGYAQDDGTVEFYQRVVSVIPEGAVVLDLGAGRGSAFYAKLGPWKHWLLRLGKKYSRRIGADVDPAVKNNPELDQAEIIEPGKPLPFADQTFDLILCDWVLEHIEDPVSFAAEVRRVLKVGGWFCARTPNRWSYYAVGVRLMNEAMEAKALRFLQPNRKEIDTFPKIYRLNTLRDIRQHFSPNYWADACHTSNPNPAYHGNQPWLFHLLKVFCALTPSSLAPVILIFVRRAA